MASLEMSQAFEVAIILVVFTCVFLLMTVSVIAILAIVGVLKIPEYYTKKLFQFLIIEVVSVSMGAFGAAMHSVLDAKDPQITEISEGQE